MKVIVAIDDCAHMCAFPATVKNLKALLKDAIENGIPYSGVDVDPIKGVELLVDEETTAEQLIEAMYGCCGRSRGCRLDIIDLEEYNSCSWWG